MKTRWPRKIEWIEDSTTEFSQIEFCCLPACVSEALDCLQSGTPTNNDVATELGVSTRTLQRVVNKHTGKSPHFWFSVARVRRAARRLREFDRLTDAEAAFGFSNQAHMAREVVRWFGVTSGSIKVGGSEIFGQLQQSGYG